MAFVLDASISAVWALADESSPIAEIAERRLNEEIALVPPIWWYEIRNLLIISERRNRVTADDSAEFLALLASYPIQVCSIGDERAILAVARQYRLSFYDAAYLSAAYHNRVPLATLDKVLQAAALASGVLLLV
jgi:predicted nucleic acid-binding protein